MNVNSSFLIFPRHSQWMGWNYNKWTMFFPKIRVNAQFTWITLLIILLLSLLLLSKLSLVSPKCVSRHAFLASDSLSYDLLVFLESGVLAKCLLPPAGKHAWRVTLLSLPSWRRAHSRNQFHYNRAIFFNSSSPDLRTEHRLKKLRCRLRDPLKNYSFSRLNNYLASCSRALLYPYLYFVLFDDWLYLLTYLFIYLLISYQPVCICSFIYFVARAVFGNLDAFICFLTLSWLPIYLFVHFLLVYFCF